MLWWKKGLEHRCEISLETCVISPPAHLSPPAQQPLLSLSGKHLAFLLVQQRETVYTEYSQALLYICPYNLRYIDYVILSENVFLTSWIGALRNAMWSITLWVFLEYPRREATSTFWLSLWRKNESLLIVNRIWTPYGVVRWCWSISIKKVVTKKQTGGHTHAHVPQEYTCLGWDCQGLHWDFGHLPCTVKRLQLLCGQVLQKEDCLLSHLWYIALF